MAELFDATCVSSGARVVVKRILPEYAAEPDFLRYFVHEGRVGLRLHHPNIVRTIEAGEFGGVSFLVLEYLEGISLFEVLRRGAALGLRLPIAAIVRLVVDAARGLHHTHAATDALGRPLGLIHRDVSPHNLFVCLDGTTKLIDFGIAKGTTQLHRTRTGIVKGKLSYLAPEQVRLEPIDHRVDVFALGIVLHELLTGRPLFHSGDDEETLQRIIQLPIPSPDELRPEVPAGVAAITLRALQRSVERRLPSAGALADALEAVAAVEGLECTRAAVAGVMRALDELANASARSWTQAPASTLPAPDPPPSVPLPLPAPATPPPAPAVAVPPVVAAHLIAQLFAQAVTRVRNLRGVRRSRTRTPGQRASRRHDAPRGLRRRWPFGLLAAMLLVVVLAAAGLATPAFRPVASWLRMCATYLHIEFP